MNIQSFFCLSLTLVLCCVGSGPDTCGQTSATPEKFEPVNRLGAHFDASAQENERRSRFQNAVAKTIYHGLGQQPTIARDRNSGLPYPSSGSSPAPATARRPGAHPPHSQVGHRRNVVYGGSPQDNSFDRNRIQQPSGFRPTLQDGNLRVYDCSIQFIDDIELPALESGQIKELFVKEGDAVQAGQVVGQIDDTLFKHMLEQAKLKQEIADKKATDNTSISAADNEIGLADEEYRRTRNLYLKRSKSESEYEQAKFRLQLARLKRVAAQNEKDFAYGESMVEQSRVQEAEDRIRRHKLVSGNFKGFVIDIARDPLEWVNAGDTVMRIARMDRLWVQGIVNANDVNPHELMNRPVRIMVQMARGERKEFEGQVVNVGLERESATNYMIKAEVKNEPVGRHWVLQPGSTVEMTISLDVAATNTAQAQPTVSER